MPFGLAAAPARWHSTQQLRSRTAQQRPQHRCGSQTPSQTVLLSFPILHPHFSWPRLSLTHRESKIKRFSLCKSCSCCFAPAKAQAADQGSGLLHAQCPPTAAGSKEQLQSPGNHRRSPLAPWHRTRISHPSWTRVSALQPGRLEGTEPQPRTGARGHRESAAGADKADGRTAQLT